MFLDVAKGTADERRFSIVNDGGTGLFAIGTPRGRTGHHDFTTSVAGLTRNDLMILSENLRQVAETLPWEEQT